MCWEQIFLTSRQQQKKAQGSTGQQQSVSIIYGHFASRHKKKKEEWLIVSEWERGQKEVGGEGEGAAGNTRPQPCPPSDLSLSPFCRAIKGKTIFSYCFIKRYVALFIAVSPDSYSIPAAAVCTAPDRTEKAYWSSFRWNMELSESVNPPPPTPHRGTLHATVYVCVLVCFR